MGQVDSVVRLLFHVKVYILLFVKNRKLWFVVYKTVIIFIKQFKKHLFFVVPLKLLEKIYIKHYYF